MSAELWAGGAEWVDEFVLALAARGVTDRWVGQQRAWVRELLVFAGCPVWAVSPADVDGWLAAARVRGAGTQTRGQMAHAVLRFYVFVQARHGRDVEDVTGRPVVQPVDEFNRPRRLTRVGVRMPPSVREIEILFTAWRSHLPGVRGRGFLVAARDYVAASLWRRVGLRINETVGLEVGDWYPHAGTRGMLHVRCGKGAKGSGPRPRLVPAIDGVDRLLAWWLSQVRWQFGDELAGGRAALLPSRFHTTAGGGLRPACAVTLRQGLAQAVERWLPAWAGRLTPHPLRHFCASHLYRQGMDLEAIGALLGHTWLSTTARYVHVPAERIEWCWQQANTRVAGRLLGPADTPAGAQ
ncbi:tyrosine-type recombinase/integrase [Streptomyces sp. NPDC014864]|uniref:tyrosine-type recombinase/integrase n=1 Tax=Streptomyces sp. NPDC014864 TaxID=3364924 RepID=UPI0036F8D9C3